MDNYGRARAISAIELRSAAWCRREAARLNLSWPARRAEIAEHKNRIAEARYHRIYAQLSDLHRVGGA